MNELWANNALNQQAAAFLCGLVLGALAVFLAMYRNRDTNHK
jgi:flagellar biosynthesis/type III secretory pathway M-ring protein FliF/YscJ